MAGSFGTKKSQDTIYTIIRGTAKKTFFISLFLYYLSHLLQQIQLTSASNFFDTTTLLGLALAGFIFMITFIEQETKKARISRSDWALLGLFGIISLGFNIIAANDMQLLGTLASVILVLFAFGLVLYVWNGSDENVTFSLFKRDKRLKFPTYFKTTALHWTLSAVIVIIALVAGDLLLKDSNPTPIIKTVTPTLVPPISTSPTLEITPSTTVEPTFAPTPIQEPTSIPTPTVAPTPISIDTLPNEYKIYVLNGSGVTGIANEIRQKLEAAGVDVYYTGDAGSFDYTETQILYNSEFISVADAAEQVLNSAYQPITKRLFNVNERYSQYNVVIIHGQ